MFSVYLITFKSNKVYVGMTKDVKNRKKAHHKVFNAKNEKIISFDVLFEYETALEASVKEDELIKIHFDNSFNKMIDSKYTTEEKIQVAYEFSHDLSGGYKISKEYDEMLEKIIKSNRDMTLIIHLKRMINDDFFLHINITKEAKKIGVGRDKLSKFISALVDAKFLYRIDVGFKANPHMYLPYMARDVLDKQNEWNELMKGLEDER